MGDINNLVRYSYLEEINMAVPWRSGQIKLIFGRTGMGDLPTDCMVLNDLKMVANLKPSFLFTLEDFSLLNNPGDGGNGYIIAAKNADDLEYKKLREGTCKVTTYFFGMPKEGRLFDWFYRIFETGFKISNFEGFPKDDPVFRPDAVLHITCKKKDYSHPGFIIGGLDKNSPFKIPARIRRSK